MAEPINEEELPGSTQEQPANTPEETIPAEEATTTDINQEPENMEVHHHPKLHHKPKPWREYFLEFVMIFLAVTLGFIAENIREHIAEHKNAKILAQSLLEDVKSDTASLHSLISFSSTKITSADSLLTMLHTPRNTWNDTSFYRDMLPMLTSFPFKSSDGTYTQMKTSGTLRYFPQPLVNIINAYDVQLRKTQYRDDVEDKGAWILANPLFDILDVEVITDIRFKQPIVHEMYIRLENKEATDRFINLIAVNKGFRARSFQEYLAQLKIADKLIEALKKEYNLD